MTRRIFGVGVRGAKQRGLDAADAASFASSVPSAGSKSRLRSGRTSADGRTFAEQGRTYRGRRRFAHGDEFAHGRTFADGLSGRDNAFGVLRLVLASMVIVSHAFPMGGFGPDPLWHGSGEQTDVGNLGLLGFFAISGYLITRSAASCDVVQFLWRRLLRIYPGVFVALVVGAVVVGPVFYAVSHGSTVGYWTSASGGPLTYVTENLRLAILQFGIHDVFSANPYNALTGHAYINGSLWTLGYEFRCYVIVAFLAVAGVLSRARWVVPAVTLLVGVSATVEERFSAAAAFNAWLLGTGEGIKLGFVFLCGATIAAHPHRVPLARRFGLLCLAVAGGTLLTGNGFFPAGHLAFAYVILWLAADLPERTHHIGATNDISYGLYVYGWPVQESLATFALYRAGLLPWVVLNLVTTLPLAWLSWRYVERPALALKDRGPGRGLTALPSVTRLPPAKSMAARWAVGMAVLVVVTAVF